MRRAYVNRSAGEHTLLSDCWITIDGENITPDSKRSSILNGFYCYFMMLFVTARARMRLWNVDHMVRASKQDEDGTGAAKKALETLNFDSYLVPKWRCLRTSYEGVPWVGLAKNVQVSLLNFSLNFNFNFNFIFFFASKKTASLPPVVKTS